MTEVVFFKNGNNIVKVSCSGHTGYAEYGSDIVCSALSSIVQSTALGLRKVIGIKLKVTRNDKKGEYCMELPKHLDADTMASSQVLLSTLLLSVRDLADGYSEFIKLEERDYVN